MENFTPSTVNHLNMKDIIINKLYIRQISKKFADLG